MGTNQPHNKIAKEELISELRRLNSLVDGKPTTKDMKKHGKHSPTPYLSRFGDWISALDSAGIQPSQTQKEYSNRNTQLSKNKVIQGIRNVYEQHGKVTKRLIDSESEISSTSVQNWFEDFNTALRASDVPVTKQVHVKESVECHNCGGQFEKMPYQIDGTDWHFCSDECRMDGMATPSVECTCDMCQSQFMQSPMALTGSNHNYCSKDCYDQYWSENTSNATTVVCEGCGQDFQRNKAQANNGPNYCSVECFHEHTSDPASRVRYYGPNWPEQRQKALKRDDYECQDCGMSVSQHERRFETSIHVHHIIPARKFEDYQKQNRTDNLITLCVDCHKKWEGLQLAPDRRNKS
jgi:hypothetical protein